MLSKIRDHATGWLGLTLLGLIALPFAFTGVYSYVGGGQITVVAEVGDREITQTEYTQAYQNYRQQVRQMLGANFRPELIDESLLRREALERMVEEVALLESATDDGYRVSEGRLAREITGIGAFQSDGVFNRELYQEQLALQGQTPERFERDLRSSLLIRQLADGIRASAFATDRELETTLKLDRQTRDVSYVRIGRDDVPAPQPPSDDELAAWYADNGAAFVEPEQVRLDYLELSVSALAAGIEISDADVERLYEEQGEQLRQAAEVRARHILLTVDEDASSIDKAAVLARANELRARILGGESFEAVAREASDDTGSAGDGGDLGFFGRDMMDPAFESAAFSMAPGELSEPVLTPFGYHLIEVTDERGGAQQTLAEARDALIELGRRQQAENRFYELADQLANLTYEQPDSLEPAAAVVGLTVARSPWLSERGESDWALADGRVLTAAFSEEVLKGGINSEVIELDADHLLVVRVAEHRDARQPELAAVRDAVADAYIAERRRSAAREYGLTLLERMEQGSRLDAIGGGEQLELVTIDQLRRNDGSVPPAVLQNIFRMERPAAGEVAVRGIELADGYALIELRAVNDGSTSDDDNLRPQLANLQSGGELDGVVRSIKSRVGTRIREENL